MSEKQLGKIDSVCFGHGGYQDAMLELSLTFSGPGWGVCVGVTGFWSWQKIGEEPSEDAAWSNESRDAQMIEMLRRIDKILEDAKVSDVAALKGKPVEVTFNPGGPGSKVEDWRILTEVL